MRELNCFKPRPSSFLLTVPRRLLYSSVAVIPCLCVGGVCFINVCFSSLLPLVPREDCTLIMALWVSSLIFLILYIISYSSCCYIVNTYAAIILIHIVILYISVYAVVLEIIYRYSMV